MRGVLAVLGVVLLGLLQWSCNSYEKLLKSTNTEQQYLVAMQYYQKGKYGKAKELLERVLPMSRVTARADSTISQNAILKKATIRWQVLVLNN